MTHVPSDDERRALYLGLKGKGYDNATRAKLTFTPPQDVELPDGRIDLSKVDLPPANAISAMYADLFDVTAVQLFHPGMEPKPNPNAIPGENPCEISRWHTENCPPFETVKLRTMPLVPPDAERCTSYVKYDGVNIRCERKKAHYTYTLGDEYEDVRCRFDADNHTLRWAYGDETIEVTIHDEA